MMPLSPLNIYQQNNFPEGKWKQYFKSNHQVEKARDV